MHYSCKRMDMAPLMTLNSMLCIDQSSCLFECWAQVRHCSPACLVFILCFPHQFLCSSSFRYSSFSNPSAPGSVLHFYFVCRWTEMNKGKSNIKCAVCSRIYTPTSSSILKYADEMCLSGLHYIHVWFWIAGSQSYYNGLHNQMLCNSFRTIIWK